MRIEAQGDGADATLAVMSERDSARRRAAARRSPRRWPPPTWCWRRRSSRSPTPPPARRRARPGVRIGTLPGRHRGDAGPADERRPGRDAPPRLGDRQRRSTAAPRRGSPAATAATCGSASRAGSRSSTPANSATAAPSATCPAARASSPRSRGRRRARWSSTARSPASACSTTPVSLTVRDGHLTEADRRRRRAAAGAAHRPRRGRHQRRRARDRHQRRGDPDRQHPRGREDPRHRHVAFGASAAIGGTVQVPVHLDCVVLEPTVEIDGETIVSGGELLV